MKGIRFVLLSSLLSSSSLLGQVQELWTTGFTNTLVLAPSPPPDASLTNYFFSEGTVDYAGNTIVAGIAYVNIAENPETRTNFPAVLVEKIDSHGQPLWQYFNPQESGDLVEALETDLAGNIFFITALDPVKRVAALTKLSPAGRLLWQSTENDAAFSITRHFATVKADSAGNTFFFMLRNTIGESNEPHFDLVLSKIDPLGGTRWQQILPWDGKPFDVNMLSKGLSIFPDGSVAAAAGNTIWKLDPMGRILWTTQKGYPSILASPKGTVCATWFGEAYAVFSKEGKLLDSGTAISGQGVDVQAVSRQSNFLLANYGVVEELSANGRVSWQNVIRLAYLPGAVPATQGGWFVVGGDVGMNLIRLDKNGSEISRTPISGYNYTGTPYLEGYMQIRQPLHKSSDGTVRVIYDLRNSDFNSGPYGVAITAFQESDNLKRL